MQSSKEFIVGIFHRGEFLQLSMIENVACENYVYVHPNWASPTHSGSSTTCWCCTFLSYPTRKHSYHLQRVHYLLACATNKCVQNGGSWKGKFCTMRLEREASWDMSLVYLWKHVGLLYAHVPLNVLACFMLMHLCTQSAWWVQHQ